MPMPKTTSEILEDEQEVNKLVNNYLLELFVVFRKKFSLNSLNENMDTFNMYLLNSVAN